MAAYQSCRDEWERNTTPNHRLHRLGKWHEEFRRYGNSEAWLEWKNEHQMAVEITKFETPLEFQNTGSAKHLLKFLMTLADKYKIMLFGNAAAYYLEETNFAWPGERAQAKLENLYKKSGFEIEKRSDRHAFIMYRGKLYTGKP